MSDAEKKPETPDIKKNPKDDSEELERALEEVRRNAAKKSKTTDDKQAAVPADTKSAKAPGTTKEIAKEESAKKAPSGKDTAEIDAAAEDTDKNEEVYSYDAVPYTAHPFQQTHPDRLAVMATLFGLEHVPVNKCRILELGCAAGGNIIPMAVGLPDSELVGVDLSAVQIEEGQKIVDELGIKNLTLKHASIVDIDDSWGKFDYVICHGVFSWVPEEVKEKIMSVSSRNLSPKGIAYISYNTYPGWHMREIIRRTMQYHSNQFDKPEVRINQSRAILRFLANSVPDNGQPYSNFLKAELDLLQRNADSYLFHEHLEDVNTPMYFHEFAERAEKHDLQYLGETDLTSMLARGFPPETMQTIQRLSTDLIRGEQYMDFLRNRQFRQTLLVHKDREIDRKVPPERIRSLRILASSMPEQEIDLTNNEPLKFKTRNGASIDIQRPITKAALQVLREKLPAAVEFETLITEALDRFPPGMVKPEPEEAAQRLMADLSQCYIMRAVDLKTWQPKFATEVSEKPTVNKLTRVLFENGRQPVNPNHQNVQLGPVAKKIVPFLDGNTDKDTLKEKVGELVLDGVISLRKDGQLKTNPKEAPEEVAQYLEQGLARLTSLGLMES